MRAPLAIDGTEVDLVLLVEPAQPGADDAAGPARALDAVDLGGDRGVGQAVPARHPHADRERRRLLGGHQLVDTERLALGPALHLHDDGHPRRHHARGGGGPRDDLGLVVGDHQTARFGQRRGLQRRAARGVAPQHRVIALLGLGGSGR